MKNNGMWTRRDLLKSLAASAGAFALPITARHAMAAEPVDLDIRLTAAPDALAIWTGEPTRVLRFTGEVLQGRADALRPSDSYLGPTLDLRRGERIRVRFRNLTGEPSIVHWHGMIVPEEADGHPRFAVRSGNEYVYEFTVRNPAGTYLYHPHPHGETGAQVYRGLAGLLVVREPDERERGLPFDELSLVIQDRRVGAGNQLVYSRHMMARMTGALGDTVLVNGRSDAHFSVTPNQWRLRLANVSNARIYKLAWSDGRPLRIIANDNGLLSSAEGPVERPYVVLAPFERVEILEDFGSRRRGAEIALESQAFTSLSMGGMSGMMGGMMGGRRGGMMGSQQGDPMHIARFRVVGSPRPAADALRLPSPAPAPEKPAIEVSSQLAFRHMQGFFNGRSFEMSAVANDERLRVGKAAVWTFSNDGPGMAMPHPIHIHGVRFRILERSRGGAPGDLRDGLVDAGFKDTFIIFPGERVRVHVVPTQPGLFMYHCHNLEHEDSGMMRNCLFET